MSNPINTQPIQQFINQVKSADLAQQKEIRLDIKTAKALAYCMSDLNCRLLENYDTYLKKLALQQTEPISIRMDGGNL